MAEITRVLFALIVRVGVDLAKNVIQVHAVDRTGRRGVAGDQARAVPGLVRAATGGLPGGDGGVLGRAPLGLGVTSVLRLVKVCQVVGCARGTSPAWPAGPATK